MRREKITFWIYYYYLKNYFPSAVESTNTECMDTELMDLEGRTHGYGKPTVFIFWELNHGIKIYYLYYQHGWLMSYKYIHLTENCNLFYLQYIDLFYKCLYTFIYFYIIIKVQYFSFRWHAVKYLISILLNPPHPLLNWRSSFQLPFLKKVLHHHGYGAIFCWNHCCPSHVTVISVILWGFKHWWKLRQPPWTVCLCSPLLLSAMSVILK